MSAAPTLLTRVRLGGLRIPSLQQPHLRSPLDRRVGPANPGRRLQGGPVDATITRLTLLTAARRDRAYLLVRSGRRRRPSLGGATHPTMNDAAPQRRSQPRLRTHRRIRLRRLRHTRPRRLHDARRRYQDVRQRLLAAPSGAYHRASLEPVRTAWYAAADHGSADAAAGNTCSGAALAYAAEQVGGGTQQIRGSASPRHSAPPHRRLGTHDRIQEAPPPGYQASMLLRASRAGWPYVGGAGFIGPGNRIGLPDDNASQLDRQVASSQNSEKIDV